jgi:ribonuclease inhibitor
MDTIKSLFFNYLSNEISLMEFENRIYENKLLEEYFGKDTYTELISYNYKIKDIKNTIKEFVKKHFDWNEYLEWERIIEEKRMNEISQSTITIKLGDINSIGEFHKLFQEKLKFPEFYGKNWNAFWDAITGLVAMPKVLELIGWDDFAEKMKDDSKVLYGIISRYNSLFYSVSKIVIK